MNLLKGLDVGAVIGEFRELMSEIRTLLVDVRGLLIEIRDYQRGLITQQDEWPQR